MSRSTFTFRRTPAEESARAASAAKHGVRSDRRRSSGLTDQDLILMGKGPLQAVRKMGRAAGGAR